MDTAKRFGKCEQCGNSGTDLDSGDRESGYELKFFDGKWLCPIHFAEARDEDADNIKQSQDVDSQNFRSAVGITR